MIDNLEFLSRHPTLLGNTLESLNPADQSLLQRLVDREPPLRAMFKDNLHGPDPDMQALLSRLQTPVGDQISAVLCRIHYMRDKDPVPESLKDMADYAKRVYNTRKGRATAQLYLDAYNTLVKTMQQKKEVEP